MHAVAKSEAKKCPFRRSQTAIQIFCLLEALLCHFLPLTSLTFPYYCHKLWVCHVAICAKFFPRQLRGLWAKGEKRWLEGVFAAIGQPTRASSSTTLQGCWLQLENVFEYSGFLKGTLKQKLLNSTVFWNFHFCASDPFQYSTNVLALCAQHCISIISGNWPLFRDHILLKRIYCYCTRCHTCTRIYVLSM